MSIFIFNFFFEPSLRASLVTARAALSQDIRMKTNTLEIDSGKCLSIRIMFPHNNRFVKNSRIISSYSFSQSGYYNKYCLISLCTVVLILNILLPGAAPDAGYSGVIQLPESSRLVKWDMLDNLLIRRSQLLLPFKG